MVEETITEQVKPRWCIDLNWYQQNNRSFLVLARHCLCPKCYERLNKKEVSLSDLLRTIKDCCSQKPDFITERLPLLEGIFRLLLANGNQPLDLEALREQLRKQYGRSRPISAETLSRLLASDRFYGLRPVQE